MVIELLKYSHQHIIIADIMNHITRAAIRGLVMTPKYCFQFPHQHSETHDKVFRPNSARSDRQEDHQVRE